jgi:predicted ATP-grasp superfamily ATP-dependent carboligase
VTNSSEGLRGTSILITDVGQRKSLPIIRSLGRAGVRVTGLTTKRLTVGGMSRYCAETIRCPDYTLDPNGFLEFLRELCERTRPTVFLPLEDRAIELCLEHPEAWEPYTKALLPSLDAMDLAYDKWQTLVLARMHGVTVPNSFSPETREEVEELASTWEGPAVVKPRKTSGSRGLRYVDHPDQLPAAWSEVAVDFPRPIIQERIPHEGAGLGVFILIDQEAEVVGLFGHRRLREYPVSGGPSTLRISHRDDDLIEQSLRLLRAIDFRGVAMVEFKEDPHRGQPVLMEVNPRFWGSIQLAVSTGVDFPVLYHRLAAGLPVTPVLDFEEGVYGRWLLPGDVLHFLTNPKRFGLRPGFFRFWGKNLHYDIVSWRDPLPMLGIVIESFRRLRSRR